MTRQLLRIPVLLIVLFIAACQQPTQPNELTAEEKQNGWVLLFDGKTTQGWHLYNGGQKASVWEVKDSALYCNPVNGKEHGDLVSDEAYENFEFKFAWKMSADGNSGVFINAIERDTIPAAWFSGPEYQLLGDGHEDNKIESKRAGCLYGFAPQKTSVATRPVDAWNESVIKQQDGKVQFYLNGVLTAEEDFKSQAWADKVGQSGFSRFPEFGKYTKGHIVLQDWAKGVAFRNIKVRKL